MLKPHQKLAAVLAATSGILASGCVTEVQESSPVEPIAEAQDAATVKLGTRVGIFGPGIACRRPLSNGRSMIFMKSGSLGTFASEVGWCVLNGHDTCIESVGTIGSCPSSSQKHFTGQVTVDQYLEFSTSTRVEGLDPAPPWTEVCGDLVAFGNIIVQPTSTLYIANSTLTCK